MLHKFERALDLYFILVYQYCCRRINAIFGSDNDSKSNLSFSDVNVDTDLSDLSEVQEFSEEESGKSESEDSKSNNNSIASDELRLIASNSRKFFPPSFLRWNGNNISFSFCSITESFVLKPLKTLKTNKAIGLDRISARLLKDSAECMAPILIRRFNRSLEASTFPSIWKCRKVTALFKGGDRNDSNNYTSITVLPTISKILKQTVHQQLYKFLSVSKFLTPHQFGFHPKLATVTALADFTDNILLVLIKAASLEQFS